MGSVYRANGNDVHSPKSEEGLIGGKFYRKLTEWDSATASTVPSHSVENETKYAAGQNEPGIFVCLKYLIEPNPLSSILHENGHPEEQINRYTQVVHLEIKQLIRHKKEPHQPRFLKQRRQRIIFTALHNSSSKNIQQPGI